MTEIMQMTYDPVYVIQQKGHNGWFDIVGQTYREEHKHLADAAFVSTIERAEYPLSYRMIRRVWVKEETVL